MKISVIFSTYNSPDWLEKVLWGFNFQSYTNFEIIIADDGSNKDTKECIETLKNLTDLTIKHVWHEDHGFQKTKILNKALKETTGEYIIFTDGDCIPRADFVETHVQLAEPGYFLSGGYFKLPMETSLVINRESIESGDAFNPDWLIKHGLQPTHKIMKLKARGWKQQVLNKLTPTGATWNGHNASTWRNIIFDANGFDERMQYGGEDRELGERLFNRGIKSKQIRYSAICLHLDHERGYVTDEMKQKNRSIRNETRKNKLTRTLHGIEQSEV